MNLLSATKTNQPERLWRSSRLIVFSVVIAALVASHRPERESTRGKLVDMSQFKDRSRKKQLNFLDQIIPLCDYEFPIFRCRERDKRPLATGWQAEATSDPDKLAKLFGGRKAFNVGLACGHDVVVLDVDGQPGEESLYKLERKNGPLPETAMTRTGSGGRHHLFRPPTPDTIKGRIGFEPGLDFKAD